MPFKAFSGFPKILVQPRHGWFEKKFLFAKSQLAPQNNGLIDVQLNALDKNDILAAASNNSNKKKAAAMKVLKILGGIILILVVLWAVLGLIGPKESGVMEEKITINAPQELIYQEVSDYKKFYEWSPWSKKDPNAKVTYSGDMGQVGSKYEWVSENPDVGSGSMEVKTTEPFNSIASEMRMDLGFTELQSTTGFKLAPVEGGIEVTWDIHGPIPFPFRAMALFGDMNEQARPDFQNGLKSLKELCETKAAEMAANAEPEYAITQSDFPGMTYVGVKGDNVSMDDVAEFYGESFGKFFGAAAAAKLEPVTRPIGVMLTWNEEEMSGDIVAGAGFSDPVELDGFETVTVEAGQVLTIDYYGPYEDVGPAHGAMDAYMKDNGLEQNGPVVEEYITDPGEEADQSKWLTKIYYFVK